MCEKRLRVDVVAVVVVVVVVVRVKSGFVSFLHSDVHLFIPVIYDITF